MSTTERIFKANKVIKLNFSGLTTTQLLTDSNGVVYQDISDVNWQRISIESFLSALTGTTPTFRASLVTTNDQNNAGSTSDPAATQADGSTTFQAASQTAAGRSVVSCGKIASNGASASNIGKYIGVLVTLGGTTPNATGSVFVFVEGQ